MGVEKYITAPPKKRQVRMPPALFQKKHARKRSQLQMDGENRTNRELTEEGSRRGCLPEIKKKGDSVQTAIPPNAFSYFFINIP